MIAKLTNRQKDKLIDAARNPIQFVVSGAGSFPLDMLRYDLCWPATEQDSNRLEKRWQLRQVELHALKEPTVARWESFGWQIVR